MSADRQNSANDILGVHQSTGINSCISSNDTITQSNAAHRELRVEDSDIPTLTSHLRSALIKHHANPDMLERTRQQRNSLLELGYPATCLRRFPTADKTQKGNLAEVFLAEYLTSTPDVTLPVYRLRYNPNIEQAMKGDDVLAFDFESNPIRILVGESKFRATPSKKAVTDIVEGLFKSHYNQIPMSLQFVADRLFESGNIDLGQKIADCAYQIAQGRLRPQYVGLLMSNTNAASHVNSHTENELHNLVMISFGINNPNNLIPACYNNIEEESVDGDSF